MILNLSPLEDVKVFDFVDLSVLDSTCFRAGYFRFLLEDEEEALGFPLARKTRPRNFDPFFAGPELDWREAGFRAGLFFVTIIFNFEF